MPHGLVWWAVVAGDDAAFSVAAGTGDDSVVSKTKLPPFAHHIFEGGFSIELRR
jgi:hypothetical protein